MGPQFVTDEQLAMVIAQREQEIRAQIYMDDLRAVLSAPEGRRVLRHWLDEASVFGTISMGKELDIIKKAALQDYGHLRMGEICAAAPVEFLRVMLAGMEKPENKKE